MTVAIAAVAVWLVMPVAGPGAEQRNASESRPAAELAPPVTSGANHPDAARTSPDHGPKQHTSRPNAALSQGKRGVDDVLMFLPLHNSLTDDEALEILIAARSGKPSAQSSMGFLEKSCSNLLRIHPDAGEFERFRASAGGQAETGLSDLQWAQTENSLATCWALRRATGKHPESPREWLVRAARQGYGPALAALAQDQLQLGVKKLDGEYLTVQNRPAARRLFEASLKTKDPYALFSIGLYQQLDKNDLFPNLQFYNGLSWVHAACELGLDCSGNNEWLQQMCDVAGDCGTGHARGLADYVEYNLFTPSQAQEAMQHVPELVSLIRSGEWNRLQLALPGDPSLDEVLSALESGDEGDGGETDGSGS